VRAEEKEDTMEQDIKQSAGNGDWTASEDTAWGLDAAAASLEDLDRRLRPYIDAHPFVAVWL
jgi:hypothetical protein